MLRLGLQTFFGGHHSGHKKGMGGFQEQALGRPEGTWERSNFSTHTEARRHLNSQSHWPMLTPPALELSLSPTLVFSSSAASASRPRLSRPCPQRLPRQPGRRGCLPWPGVSQHPTPPGLRVCLQNLRLCPLRWTPGAEQVPLEHLHICLCSPPMRAAASSLTFQCLQWASPREMLDE